LLAAPRAQEARPPAGDFALRAARERMRAEGALGLCFVVPRTWAELGGRLQGEELARWRVDFARRLQALGIVRGGSAEALERATPVGTVEEQFATMLHRLLLTGDVEAQLLLLEAVLLVAERDAVGAEPGENLVLLDARGQRRAGAQIDLRDDASFAWAAEALLAPARTPASELPAPARAARAEMLELAASVDPDQRGAALRLLVQQRRALLPALQQRLAAAAEAERTQLAATAGYAVQAIAGADRADLLPFGLCWQDDLGDVDPCPACGMMRMSTSARRMLTFAAR
jgi:hypothetical protein